MDTVEKLAERLMQVDSIQQSAAMSQLHKYMMENWGWTNRRMVAEVAFPGVVNALLSSNTETQEAAAYVLEELIRDYISYLPWPKAVPALRTAAACSNVQVAAAAMDTLTDLIYRLESREDAKHVLQPDSLLTDITAQFASTDLQVQALAANLVNAVLWNTSIWQLTDPARVVSINSAVGPLLRSPGQKVQQAAMSTPERLYSARHMKLHDVLFAMHKATPEPVMNLVVQLLSSSDQMVAHTAIKALQRLEIASLHKNRMIAAGAVQPLVRLTSSKFSPPGDISSSERACCLLYTLVADMDEEILDCETATLKTAFRKASAQQAMNRLCTAGTSHARLLARFICYMLERL